MSHMPLKELPSVNLRVLMPALSGFLHGNQFKSPIS